ncbi:hypothetical protein BACCELL_00267 [Bacteroides cellulosilyticus DSM 14838]|uniref:Uncharacterized protein n=1 Tax=Bacteroides cellulosilyticus DSM 14838 TaxID=537012 RepID=E2N7M4_9BACE|nr:hypothetical protein BACCELL_00267 [Bacteroides cellulosilyticus DSM 14838]
MELPGGGGGGGSARGGGGGVDVVCVVAYCGSVRARGAEHEYGHGSPFHEEVSGVVGEGAGIGVGAGGGTVGGYCDVAYLYRLSGQVFRCGGGVGGFGEGKLVGEARARRDAHTERDGAEEGSEGGVRSHKYKY